MDTAIVKERIQQEIVAIETRLEDLQDEIVRLDHQRATFRDAHEAIVKAEELANQLRLLGVDPRLETAPTEAQPPKVEASQQRQEFRAEAQLDIFIEEQDEPLEAAEDEEQVEVARAAEQHEDGGRIVTHLQVVDKATEPEELEEDSQSAQFEAEKLVPNFLRQYL